MHILSLSICLRSSHYSRVLYVEIDFLCANPLLLFESVNFVQQIGKLRDNIWQLKKLTGPCQIDLLQMPFATFLLEQCVGEFKLINYFANRSEFGNNEPCQQFVFLRTSGHPNTHTLTHTPQAYNTQTHAHTHAELGTFGIFQLFKQQKMIFCISYQVNLTLNSLLTWYEMQKNHFFYWKN